VELDDRREFPGIHSLKGGNGAPNIREHFNHELSPHMTPFHSPEFRRLWYSGLASSSAQGMERTTTAWLALQTGEGAFAVGLVFAARSLPSLLLGLASGTIADRADRPRQLLAVAAGALLLAASFGLLIIPSGVHAWQLAAFAFASGCLQVFDTPARQALVLDTVPRDLAPRALALNALGGSFCAALGAFGAGVLILSAGAASCFVVVALGYGLMGLLVAGLHVTQAHRGVVAVPFIRALKDAARLIVDIPVVGTLMTAGIACEMLGFSFGTALPVFAQDVLAAGPEGLGTLNAAVAIGGALAVMMLSLLPVRVRREPLLAAVFIGFGLSIIVFAATRDMAVAALVLVVLGFCAASFDVLLQMLIQMAVPDKQRGRAVGVWVLGIGSGPVGHLEMGWLVGALGAPIALLINGMLTVTVATTLLVRARAYILGKTSEKGSG
jgi:MFS family permease